MSGAAESDDSVSVPESVLEGLDFVKESRETNMRDFNVVMRIAYENGFHATVAWMDDHKDRYYQGFMNGFTAHSDDD